MKIVVAIDSFKGCLSSFEAGEALCAALSEVYGEAELIHIPVSDGGDGMLEVFAHHMGCRLVELPCHDALMRPIMANVGIADGGVCVVESAKSCGIDLIEPENLNPILATTYGLGELILAAMAEGCTDFLIGLGGSATSDCGLGMLRAFTDRFGNDWWECPSHKPRIRLASDVLNPLCGTEGAAMVFAKQKGASQADIACLERRAKTFAEMSARKLGYDRSTCSGAGAAGGLGYAFMQYFDAELVSGADYLLEKIQFAHLLSDATCVITGEGRADRQTLMGKLPSKILQLAKAADVPVHLVAGCIADEGLLRQAGFASVCRITDPNMPLDIALQPSVAKANILSVCREHFRNVSSV